MRPYLRHAWYVAGLADEFLPGALVARTLLGEPLVLFRTDEGGIAALADRCPHRFAPLSAGKLCGGGRAVECAYHGLRFGADGACVHNPHGDGRVPKAAAVPARVVRVRDHLVWLWAGDAAEADEALIPDFSHVTSAPDDATVRGHMPTACDYQLLVDNILDLTHADYLHAGVLGSGALSRCRPQVSEPAARSVRIAWISSGDVAPPAFDMHLREQGRPTDQWTEVTWTAPGCMLLNVGATLQEGRASTGSGGNVTDLHPFTLSLSKGRGHERGFDKLSPNGVECVDSAAGAHGGGPSTGSGRTDHGDGVRAANLHPFSLGLSKGLGHERGFDKLSLNGVECADSATGAHGWPSTGSGRTDHGDGVCAANLHPFTLGLSKGRGHGLGFDKLSPNGVECADSATGAHGWPSTGSGRTDHGDGVCAANLHPFTLGLSMGRGPTGSGGNVTDLHPFSLSLSKGRGHERGFDKLSPNGAKCADSAAGAHGGGPSTGSGRTDHGDGVRAANLLPFSLSLSKGRGPTGSGGNVTDLQPFSLSLSKGRGHERGFDKLSLNGVECADSAAGAHGGPSTGSGRTDGGDGVRAANLLPFTLSLSKGLGHQRGFDKLSPNGVECVDSAAGAHGGPSTGSGRTDHGDGVRAANLHPFTLSLSKGPFAPASHRMVSLLAALLLAVVPTWAAESVGAALDRPAQMVRAPERAVLLGAAQVGNAWVAVGERGLALRSEDGGAHWQQVATPVSVTLTAVRFTGDRHGLAVGHGGTVLVTEDGGRSWARRLDGRRIAELLLADAKERQDAAAAKAAEQLRADGPDKPLLDVLTLGPGRALVIGAYGLALATEDGGATWTSWAARLDNPKGLHLYAARQRGSRIVIAGEQGLVLKSDDAGRTFQRLATPYAGSFFTLELPDDREIVLAGLRGNVWHSTDGGREWSALAVPMPVSVIGSQLAPDGTLLLANQAGFVLARRGDAFVPVHRDPLPPLTGLAAGRGGALLALSIQGVMPIASKP